MAGKSQVSKCQLEVSSRHVLAFMRSSIGRWPVRFSVVAASHLETPTSLCFTSVLPDTLEYRPSGFVAHCRARLRLIGRSDLMYTDDRDPQRSGRTVWRLVTSAIFRTVLLLSRDPHSPTTVFCWSFCVCFVAQSSGLRLPSTTPSRVL